MILGDRSAVSVERHADRLEVAVETSRVCWHGLMDEYLEHSPNVSFSV